MLVRCAGHHNAGTVDEVMVTEGEQVVVGDTVPGGDESPVTAYEVPCRRHHRQGRSREVAVALPDLLPFGRLDDERALR